MNTNNEKTKVVGNNKDSFILSINGYKLEIKTLIVCFKDSNYKDIKRMRIGVTEIDRNNITNNNNIILSLIWTYNNEKLFQMKINTDEEIELYENIKYGIIYGNYIYIYIRK